MVVPAATGPAAGRRTGPHVYSLKISFRRPSNAGAGPDAKGWALALELPGPVVDFLRVIGINWPQVNEDTVRDFAGHVRQFGSDIGDTHDQASSTLQSLGQAYQGNSYELLVSKWAALTQGHMTALLDGCTVLADALEAAAVAIVALKVEAIAELVVLAATFVADQAAAVVTFGLSEVALPLIEEAAEKLVDVLTQELVGKVVEAALNPLLELVQQAAAGISFSALEDILGVGGGSGGTGYSMDPDAVTSHAATFGQYADAVTTHAQTFAGNVAELDFS